MTPETLKNLSERLKVEIEAVEEMTIKDANEIDRLMEGEGFIMTKMQSKCMDFFLGLVDGKKPRFALELRESSNNEIGDCEDWWEIKDTFDDRWLGFSYQYLNNTFHKECGADMCKKLNSGEAVV